jgi:quinoprotein glucose dehydrogenase
LRQPSGESADRYVGSFSYLVGPERLPLFKPPWGSVVAIDMSTGEHRWRAPVGSGKPFDGAPAPILAIAAAIPQLANAPERLGWPTRSFALVTKSLLLVVQQGFQNNQRPAPFSPRQRVWDLNNLEPKLYAYDKVSGRLLAEIPVPANAGGAPMTYMAGGKQYVAFSIGGAGIPEELIALALP